MSEEKLANFLKTGKDWTRLRTTVPGIFVLKLPTYKSSPARLAVELNPVDETGKPKKRRGLILRSSRELEDFHKLYEYDKMSKLLNVLDSVNPKVGKRKKDEEVIEL